MTQPVGKAVTHQEVKHNGHGQKLVTDKVNGDISLCSVCLRAESLFFKLWGLKVDHILYILKPSSQQWSAACTVISLSLSLTTCWNCTLHHKCTERKRIKKKLNH